MRDRVAVGLANFVLRRSTPSLTKIVKRGMAAPVRELEMRQVIEDLWGCIAKREIGHLEPSTVAFAKANHELLAHG